MVVGTTGLQLCTRRYAIFVSGFLVHRFDSFLTKNFWTQFFLPVAGPIDLKVMYLLLILNYWLTGFIPTQGTF